MAKVDPRLLQEINRSGARSAKSARESSRRGGGSGSSPSASGAEAASAPIQAVITLRSGNDGKPLSPEATEAHVHEAVERARSITALEAHKVKVFKNLQSFTIEADPEFVKTLIEDDIVDSASLNKP
jgi:hypothetical protein